MAPKRSAPPPPPPPADSDEETASGSGSEESEEEEEIAYSPPPAAPKTMAPPPQKGQESEDEDDEDEDEEEVEEEDTIQVPPPLATKNPPPPPPNREESESSGEDEEEETDDEAPQPKPAPNKVAEGEEDAKPSLSEDKKAGGPIQRTWSADDEVRILEAMAAHRRDHGTLPQVEALAATLDGTLDNSDCSVASLQGKLRNLKRRYSSAANKGQRPSKDHDRRLFDLSKAVWGSTTAAANGGGALRDTAELCKLYPFLAEEVMELQKAHPGLLKREFGMIDDDKARALNKKIKKQRQHQAKLTLRRGDLIKEVTKTLIDLSDSL